MNEPTNDEMEPTADTLAVKPALIAEIEIAVFDEHDAAKAIGLAVDAEEPAWKGACRFVRGGDDIDVQHDVFVEAASTMNWAKRVARLKPRPTFEQIIDAMVEFDMLGAHARRVALAAVLARRKRNGEVPSRAKRAGGVIHDVMDGLNTNVNASDASDAKEATP